MSQSEQVYSLFYLLKWTESLQNAWLDLESRSS